MPWRVKGTQKYHSPVTVSSLVYLFNMVIFYSYVSLPEGITYTFPYSHITGLQPQVEREREYFVIATGRTW